MTGETLQPERSDITSQALAILADAKKLAQEYKRLTGKPLGITGEVAEYEAARILGLELTPARQAGYDAVEVVDGTERRLQIKGRCLPGNCKPGQRLGSLDLKKEWDACLMVLLDENFEATAIYEADRRPLMDALAKPGSRARNERGALAVSQFKSLGKLRWARQSSADGSSHSSHKEDPIVTTSVTGQTNVTNQREKMRELFRKNSRDPERTIQAYADAERAGQVARSSNQYDQSAEDYARRLFYDGIHKGWLK
jgi:hypothetical protein